MLYPYARPKAPTKPRGGASPPAASLPLDARKRGRPAKGDGERIRELPTVTVRVEPDVLALLDAEVAHRNRELARQGATTSRGAVLAFALRAFAEQARDARAAAEQGEGKGAAS